MNCLFCNIAAGTIPATILHDSKNVIAFRDIEPQAPTHILVVPKKHISTINHITEADSSMMSEMLLTAKGLAESEEISENGYRLVFNVNPAGGQAVYHIHLHILGGRQMHWPPG